MRLLDRFWSKVNKTDGCWEWTGSISADGYGQFSLFRRPVPAHRLAYELEVGETVHNNYFVCHRCDNRKCVRPDHLFLGTAADNNADMDQKGRRRSAQGKAPNARVNRDQILSIRAEHSAGVTIADLARKNSVGETTVARIVRRESWKNVV